tara:strand:+ start:1393 stop:1641 length:249 start_codon:yes stop_codon:yes gene_type:complete
MIRFVVILPMFLLTMCADAPVTPPASAFELEVEETHWNKVYHAIEYLKYNQYKKKRTSPEDVINNAIGDFYWEFENGSNGST